MWGGCGGGIGDRFLSPLAPLFPPQPSSKGRSGGGSAIRFELGECRAADTSDDFSCHSLQAGIISIIDSRCGQQASRAHT